MASIFTNLTADSFADSTITAATDTTSRRIDQDSIFQPTQKDWSESYWTTNKTHPGILKPPMSNLEVIEQKLKILKLAQSAIINDERYAKHINDEIFKLIRDI